jgi:pyrroloquinoline quinone biosynthesis protein B
MKILILGSAANGGFPHWNCNCANCDGMRNGTLRSRARTQASIAVSSNEIEWVLINASPDILTQIRAAPALQPARFRRDTGISAVMLMGAHVDHVAGLLMLREGVEIPLYCTPSVWCDLTEGLPLVHALSHYCDVRWHPLAPQMEEHLPHEVPALQLPGIGSVRFTPIALHSKAPPYSTNRELQQPDNNIGLLMQDRHSGRSLFYAPSLARMEPHVEQAMRNADCVLVDGTYWAADELMRLGLSDRNAWELGHLPLAGPGGMIETLDSLGARRKILIHINNTNPILDEDSQERALLERHGIEVAHDGMEIVL